MTAVTTLFPSIENSRLNVYWGKEKSCGEDFIQFFIFIYLLLYAICNFPSKWKVQNHAVRSTCSIIKQNDKLSIWENNIVHFPRLMETWASSAIHFCRILYIWRLEVIISAYANSNIKWKLSLITWNLIPPDKKKRKWNKNNYKQKHPWKSVRLSNLSVKLILNT
jgi:hypothetical protein